MTTELATRPGLPGRLREDGYDLPAGLTYERWLEIGETLQQMERSVQWWLGDWWNYGERHYGQMASQASKDHIEDATGYTYHTVRRAGYTAERIAPERRRSNLTFAHHAEVAPLPVPDQQRLLDQAEQNNWNRYQLRDAVRVDKELAKRRAEAMVGEVGTDEPMVWIPTVEQLTDEARWLLDANMPAERRRHAEFIRGWLAALVATDQRDQFARWGGPA